MYTQSSQMEPLYPARTGELEDLARELVAVSAQLEGHLAPVVLAEIEAFRIIEMSERTRRNILKGLLDEGLLSSPSEKGAVRLGFPATVASYWFPDL